MNEARGDWFGAVFAVVKSCLLTGQAMSRTLIDATPGT
jgi:hypothetical protein